MDDEGGEGGEGEGAGTGYGAGLVGFLMLREVCASVLSMEIRKIVTGTGEVEVEVEGRRTCTSSFMDEKSRLHTRHRKCLVLLSEC
jgi:hypothetical protein